MFYSFFIIPFLIIIHHFLIHISNAIPSGDDKMLIAFVRNGQKMQISKYSQQKYEAYLGILYYMRKNWQCDKIGEEFEEYERTECQKYRKYLNILYEYLLREYAGTPTVKPKFVYKKGIEIEGPIIYAVHCLVKISQFYFKLYWSSYNKYKLNKVFTNHFEPKLLNAERLNYKEKLPINEMILQFAIDTANEWRQTNEILDGIIRQKYNKNFEENLEEIFKKTVENAIKNGSWRINDDKHFLILYTKFDDSNTWLSDASISNFVIRNMTCPNKFFPLVKEDHLNEYEDILGIAYFMRKNWHCANPGKSKNLKNLHILYEYLFRLYLEGKNSDLANKLPAVKPIFRAYSMLCISEVIRMLNDISKCEHSCDLSISSHIYLLNEEELNYKINEEKNWISKIIQKAMGKINGLKHVKRGKQILNELSDIKKYRTEFDQKMEKWL